MAPRVVEGSEVVQGLPEDGNAPPAGPSVDVVDPEHAHLHENTDTTRWKIPLTSKCKEERAFRAGVLEFSDPTPKRLARALREVTAGGLAVVIQRRGEELQVALSATESHDGRERFLPGTTPPFVRLVDGAGEPPGISGERFQPFGVLRLAGNGKLAHLELHSLNWHATERDDCSELTVDVHAILRSEQWDASLPLKAKSTPIRDLLDPEQLLPPEGSPGVASARVPTRPLPVPLHFTFKATSTIFVR